jgi:hypothetical protein
LALDLQHIKYRVFKTPISFRPYNNGRNEMLTFEVLWDQYFNPLETPITIGLFVNLELATPGQILPRPVSVYIDNIGTDNDAIIQPLDTQLITPVSPLSYVFAPYFSNMKLFVLVAGDFTQIETGSRTRFTFVDEPMYPFSPAIGL